jgi:hypothetical protein
MSSTSKISDLQRFVFKANCIRLQHLIHKSKDKVTALLFNELSNGLVLSLIYSVG